MEKKRLIILTLAAAMLTACGDSSSASESKKDETPKADRETIYQVSLLQGLTLGDYNGSVSVKQLKQKGDTGIGTFEGVNGELIMVDGTVYRAKSDGSVETAPDDETIPFANVTFFDTDEKQDIINRQKAGGYRNVALDPDVTKSYWADFAADSRYNSERLGCYEGGATYALGVYRPTENSIMNDNIGGFNVAGRVMIYKRCMKIALGKSWNFNLADFITFDLENGRAEASYKRKSPAKRSGKFVPLGTPKVFYLGKK